MKSAVSSPSGPRLGASSKSTPDSRYPWMKNGGHVMRVRAASLWPLVEGMPLRMRVMGSNTDEEIELPPRNTKRWTIARKTAVVTAVRRGISARMRHAGATCCRSGEFIAWSKLFIATASTVCGQRVSGLSRRLIEKASTIPKLLTKRSIRRIEPGEAHLAAVAGCSDGRAQ